MARRDRHDDYRPAPALHLAGADDRGFRVITALHDYVRPEVLDQAERSVFGKNDDEVDTLECCENICSIAIGAHGPGRPFEPAHGFIAVDSNDQVICRRPRGIQHVDVSAVEQIEDAVGESDPSPSAFPKACSLRPCRNLGRGIPGRQSRLAAMGWKWITRSFLNGSLITWS